MKNDKINIHQSLIDRCRKGDKKAQFEIYKLYYKAMYNASFRIVQDSLEAEDIMQESFLSAFEKLHTYKNEVSFGAWLKRIVVNNSLDAIRKRKAELVDIDNTVIEIEEDITDTDYEAVKNKAALIKETINQLADGYRIILNLYLIEGYDHEEISEIMNISSSTSRSQYARARKKLLELLSQKQETNSQSSVLYN
ncbi:MAG: RNA polymerase [Marinilabiliales bacterium]|nr:MAG: RNA polymerase [Marinilabiliales bacterium]